MTAIRVRSLHVYPVKGCAAVDVDSIDVDAAGLLVGDRSAMIVDADTGAFVSQRHLPTLAQLTATIDGRSLSWPGGSIVVGHEGPARRVTVWEDTFDAIDLGDPSASALSDWLGRRVRLVRLPTASPRAIDPYWAGDTRPTSFADLAPVLITSTASLDDLNARRAGAGLAAVTMDRFRPNVVIDGLDAWAEDGVARLDGPGYAIQFIKPCARCKVIELDPTDGRATGDRVLESLAAFRAGLNRRGTAGVFFGQNGTVLATGSTTLRRGGHLSIKPTLSRG